jgi:hypothetical protein
MKRVARASAVAAQSKCRKQLAQGSRPRDALRRKKRTKKYREKPLSTPRVQTFRAKKKEIELRRLAQKRASRSARRSECPICFENLRDDSPALACGHRFHAACIQELAATALANGGERTHGRGTAVLCPLCRGQSYVQ